MNAVTAKERRTGSSFLECGYRFHFWFELQRKIVTVT